jgi:excisionase family DNA binding protein
MARIPVELADEDVERIADALARRLGQAAGGAEGFMTADQAAEYLACDRARIYDLVGRGALRCAREGRRTLFKREWLDELLDDQPRRAA